jgi:co-chaperonin GroES (HSP10)
MNLQPLGDRLIVEVFEEEEATLASGLVLPDNCAGEAAAQPRAGGRPGWS